MNHPDEARLNDYVDGLLDDGTAGEVEAHLTTCGDCRERAATLPEAPPPETIR